MVFFGLLAVFGMIICTIGTLIKAFKKDPSWKKWVLGIICCFIVIIGAIITDGPATVKHQKAVQQEKIQKEQAEQQNKLPTPKTPAQ